MSNDSVVDQEKLKALGRVVSTIPPERPPYDEWGNKASIVKPNEPPKKFDFEVPLKTPKD